MAEADQREMELDGLLEEADRIAVEFSLSSTEAQEDHSKIASLVRSFKSLESKRKQLLANPHSQYQCLPISKAMHSLNKALRKRPLRKPSEQFVELYHFLVVVELQPDILKDETIHCEFKQAMVDARKIGLTLCDDNTFQAAIGEDHKKKYFFKRLAKVCRAHGCYDMCSADEQTIILAEALKFETLAGSIQQETQIDIVKAQQAWVKIESYSTSTPPNFNGCFQEASKLSELYKLGSKEFQPSEKYIVKHIVVSAFKLLQEMRSRDIPYEARLQLGRAMLDLNEALRSSSVSNPHNRFDDLYEFLHCVRFEKELSRDPRIRSDIQTCVGEAYQIGQNILLSDKRKDRLESNPGKKGEFLSRLGEICHAHAIYECIAADELPAILEKGIEFFKRALEISHEKKHWDFSYPRMSDCQMRLGHYTEAIESLTNVLNPGNGIKEATAWEARCKFAECHQELGRREKINSNPTKAHEHFKIAEQWYVEAAHIWEPDIEPRSSPCRNENNRKLQGQIAWLYLYWDSPDNAGKLEAVLIFSNLVAGLLRQKDRNDAAITVLEKLLSYSLSPLARLRSLIALRQLYIWTGNQQAMQSTTQSLIEAGKLAGEELDFLGDLKDEQQTALADFEKMQDYVAHCNRRLENGDALAILKELKPMVAAQKLFSRLGKDDPVLLSLLGQAYFQVGNFEIAMKYFLDVVNLDQSTKNQGIIWMQIGDLYLAERKLDKALTAYITSHEKGGGKLSPLLKAASVCRLMSDFEQAFKFLDQIEQSGCDDKPFITKTVRARTLWAKFLITGADGDGQSACRELIKVLQDSRRHDGIAMRYLMDMLSHPDAQKFVSEILTTTDSQNLAESICHGLAKQPDIPQPILDALIHRLANQNTTVEFGKVLVKIAIRAMVRSYFTGMVGGMTFDEFTGKVCVTLLRLAPEKRRAWFLELLTAERGALSTELLHRYADESMKVFAPLLSDSESVRLKLCSPELIESLNTFLREGMPAGICPTAYGMGDRKDLCLELDSLVEHMQLLLADNVERGCNIRVMHQQAEPAWICGYYWMKAKPFVGDLLMIVRGPLQELASETARWSVDIGSRSNILEVTFAFDPIDSSRNPDLVIERTKTALHEWRQRTTHILKIVFPEEASWNVDQKIRIAIELQRPNDWPSDFSGFAPFSTYLADESRRILGGQGVESDFFRQADEYFPAANAPVFAASAPDWILFIRSLLDQQFAMTVEWFMTSDSHPRSVIHDLKKEIQIIAGSQEVGHTISDKAVEIFQHHALNIVGKMNQVVRSDMFGGGRSAIDVGANVEKLITPVRDKFPSIDIRTDYAPEVYVEIHLQLLESIVLNLVHNAIAAAKASGVAPWISLIITKLDIENRSQMLLKVANPYDPEAADNPEGTGIGLKVVRHLVEKLNSGHVFELPDVVTGKYEVGVLLPLAGDD